MFFNRLNGNENMVYILFINKENGGWLLKEFRFLY